MRVLKMPAVIHEGPEDAGDKGKDSGGSSAGKLGRPGRPGGASAVGRGELGGCCRARGWRALSPSGRAVRELQRVCACVSTSTPTSGFWKMSAANLGTFEMPAVIHEGPEDAGDKAEDCGGSSAMKLGRPGRQGGALAAGRGELGGLFRARGWRASSPSGRAVRELQRVRACFSTSTPTLGVSKMSAANLGTLEMPAVIHEGLEDSGDKVEDCG